MRGRAPGSRAHRLPGLGSRYLRSRRGHSPVCGELQGITPYKLALHSLTLDDIGPHSTHADEHTTEVIAILLASEESTMSADPSVAWDKTLVSAITNNTVGFIWRYSIINVLRVETTASKRWQAAVGSGENTSTSIVVRLLVP
jgi:hypothetical protein